MKQIKARKQLILDIANLAATFSFQAGVGAIETAGTILSYLAKHPDKIEDFLQRESFMDFTEAFDVGEGCLSFQGADGKIHSPDDLIAARAMRDARKGMLQ